MSAFTCSISANSIQLVPTSPACRTPSAAFRAASSRRNSKTFKVLGIVATVSIALAIVSINACVVVGTRKLSQWLGKDGSPEEPPSRGFMYPSARLEEDVEQPSTPEDPSASSVSEACFSEAAHTPSVLRPLYLPDIVAMKERSLPTPRRNRLRPLSLPSVVARRSMAEPSSSSRRPMSFPLMSVQRMHVQGTLSVSATAPALHRSSWV